MKPLQISADTAQKLAAKLNIPLEHLMHMPQHILLQRLAELAADNKADDKTDDTTKAPDSGSQDVK
ncbi:YycC family protein [Paenibacillus eucommiae]|uniref:tRNA A37 threonylcarbamoyltransferase TsaD n=1 Tax=Paenibacillus eucommiae TaxID=1355755 RepID=A0ABS4J190_9BACL|nr:YycC family protein [Paenibacillus eucommiae]MBP1993085.1 tRNA A37 threonylcarbamoyltransferase TsaD [Paenibacillus eucommiae]